MNDEDSRSLRQLSDHLGFRRDGLPRRSFGEGEGPRDRPFLWRRSQLEHALVGSVEAYGLEQLHESRGRPSTNSTLSR